jgi:hypothetical protein
LPPLYKTPHCCQKKLFESYLILNATDRFLKPVKDIWLGVLLPQNQLSNLT